MPHLNDDMYCSQQICIPPMYPYVLRQFAKAAIRSQPADLLRWATAYFRCLSLNLPPPIKPRLEYPIPVDYQGITPGWLKALLYQIQGNLTIGFKVLWDRWLGACLQHKTLITILCLGGFKDPMHIPVLRFIGLCASFLTDSLTHTMILVCEILTDEPEGGSAMIPVETFNDIYEFLAGIDASKAQILLNLYFRDSLLGIYEEPPPPPTEAVAEIEGEEEEEAEEEEGGLLEEEEGKDLDDGVYSCPDIAIDKGDVPEPEEQEFQLALTEIKNQDDDDLIDDDFQPSVSHLGDDESEPTIVQEEEEIQEKDIEEEALCEEEKPGSWHSKDTLSIMTDQRSMLDAIDQEKLIYIDLGIMQGDGEEMSEDYMYEQGEQFEEEAKEETSEGGKKSITTMDDLDLDDLLAADEARGKPEEIYLEAIPGIGCIVPPEMVKAVVKYMLECSKEQHGVVMPRNVRHFNCPPLEPKACDL